MKKILTILVMTATLFLATSCGTALHDGELTLPVSLNTDPSKQAGVKLVMTPKAGTMGKISINLTGLDKLNGTSLTVCGQNLALTDNGPVVSWDNGNELYTKTITDGKVSFVFYTNDYQDWNAMEPAFKIVYKGTWDNFLIKGTGDNVQITGSADKDVVLDIDMVAY